MFLSQQEIEELYDNLDKQKKGKISVKDFKKNFIAELKTFSTSNVNMIDEDDENTVNNINDIDINIGGSNSDKIGEDSCKTIKFSCIKEPRHEFFSNLKRKNRLMVFSNKKMIYYDDNFNLMGDIPCSTIKKIEILSRRKFEVYSNLKIHLIELTSNEYNMDSIIEFVET